MASLDLPALVKSPTAAVFTFASVATLVFARHFTRSSNQLKPLQRYIPSPRDTLIPFLSGKEAAALAYPPSLLPGARDVSTLYGTMRVYEWGPENGKKVVLVHGDTTPGPVLGPIADALGGPALSVRPGHYSSNTVIENEVLIMLALGDLWGRGYSDTPLDVRHDARLFTMQILFAVNSSSLSWAGEASGGFSIIGFSLGGGISMAFAAHFPYLVNSIILLAPAGILRYLPKEYETSFFRFSQLVPFSYLRKLVGRIIGVELSHPKFGLTDLDHHDQTDAEEAQDVKEVSIGVIDVPAIVQWQFDNHKGFVQSFIDTIKHGPIMHQHSDWAEVCNIIKGDMAKTSPSSQSSKLFDSKILVIFGNSDGVVVEKEVADDLSKMIGAAHVDIKVVPGGHGFPVPSSERVVKHISDFWGLPSGG